jgi:hypothetical protein
MKSKRELESEIFEAFIHNIDVASALNWWVIGMRSSSNPIDVNGELTDRLTYLLGQVEKQVGPKEKEGGYYHE